MVLIQGVGEIASEISEVACYFQGNTADSENTVSRNRV